MIIMMKDDDFVYIKLGTGLCSFPVGAQSDTWEKPIGLM